VFLAPGGSDRTSAKTVERSQRPGRELGSELLIWRESASDKSGPRRGLRLASPLSTAKASSVLDEGWR